MYSSNLMFHTLPGKTGELENELHELLELVRNVGGQHPRILHAHFASPDAANVIFAQDAPDLPSLEEQIRRVTADPRFNSGRRKFRHCCADRRNLSGGVRAAAETCGEITEEAVL